MATTLPHLTPAASTLARRIAGRPALFDAGIVAILIVVGLLEEFIAPAGDQFRHGDFLGIATVIAAGLPLLWRRRYPIPVMAAVGAFFLVRLLTGYDPGTALNTIQFVSIYSVGVYAARPAADWARGIAALFVAVGFGLWYWLGDLSFSTAVVSFVIWAGVGVLGETVYTRRKYEEALEEKARRLEAEREERARQAIAAERARISREFHDIWAHTLSLVVVQAAAAEEVFDRSPDKARQSIAAIREAGRQALAEVRRLIASDSALAAEPAPTPGAIAAGASRAPAPGISALPALADEFRRSGMSVALSLPDPLDNLPADLSLSAYRIVQQALTNTLTHGGPGAGAEIVVTLKGGDLLIDIVDNGHATPPASGPAMRQGRGLIGMRERAALFGGDLIAGPRPEGGFAVHARLPLVSTP